MDVKTTSYKTDGEVGEKKGRPEPWSDSPSAGSIHASSAPPLTHANCRPQQHHVRSFQALKNDLGWAWGYVLEPQTLEAEAGVPPSLASIHNKTLPMKEGGI